MERRSKKAASTPLARGFVRLRHGAPWQKVYHAVAYEPDSALDALLDELSHDVERITPVRIRLRRHALP